MRMPTAGFNKVLVAIDFSSHSDAALKQAVWLARKNEIPVVLAHAVRDLRHAMHCASYKARLDALYGEGEVFEHEVRVQSDERMRRMIAHLDAMDIDARCDTLLGEPYVELIRAAHEEKCDLVLAGTRGMASWEEFFVGSTAKRLIRKCPSAVWIVKGEKPEIPRTVLAATDFSDVSLKALAQAVWIAEQTDAELHMLHVTDSMDVPEDVLSGLSRANTLRDEIVIDAQRRLAELRDQANCDHSRVHIHTAWGKPWKEVARAATRLGADLVAMGTVGRGGVKGLLLGSTTEKVLNSCDCSILTVKPDDFVSPIDPAE